MGALFQSHDRPAPTVGMSRGQLYVVVTMLVMSLSWLVVYAKVVDSPASAIRLAPELALRVAQEHDRELQVLKAQMVEVYGMNPPEPAGS